MSKVITFSNKFPKGHPKAGKPTFFVDLHTVIRGDMDENIVKPAIQVLKWWQEVAYEVGQLKLKMPV